MDYDLYAISHAGQVVLRQPVSLEVPVRLQAEAGELSLFSEDTKTVLVFPEGAVLRVAAPLEPGQRVLLTNRMTRRQQPCRVVYARASRSVKGYVEVEFALPAPGFWEGDAPAPVVHDPFGELPLVTRATEERPGANCEPRDPLERVTTIAEPPAFERSFAHNSRRAFTAAMAAPVTRCEPAGRAAVTLTPVEQSLVPDIETLLLANRADEQAAEGFSTRVWQPPTAAFFPTQRPSSGRAWLIGAVAATLAMTLGAIGIHAGGLWLAPPPAPQPPAPPAWVLPPVELPALSVFELPLRPPRARDLMLLAPQAPLNAASRRPLSVANSLAAPLAPAAARRADVGAAPAPEFSVVAAPPEANSSSLNLAGFAVTSAPAPLVESKLKPLRLALSVRPVYPPLALKMRKQGDVVVQATIDVTGEPTQMKVLSGPAILHQAALNALAQWKYEPATLNGQPVAVTTAVTIKFQL